MDKREPATALALVRIGLAVVLLVDYLNVWRLGLVGPLWSRSPDGFAIGHAVMGPIALWAIAVVALVAIAVGAATRVACVAFVLASAQLATLTPDGESGLDMLARIVFVILALSRSHALWSVDAALARRLGREVPTEIPAWPRYLLLLQLVWVYFSGGMNKTAAGWGPFGGFTALANALSDPHAARFDPAWLAVAYPLTRVATALTMVFELGAPLYLLAYYFAATPDRPGRMRSWFRKLRVRWIWIGLGVSFQIGIAIGLRLGSFPYGMLALYPVLLLPAELERHGRNAATPANRASSPS
jgi:hypothetical protein